jgi:hypothetical protein
LKKGIIPALLLFSSQLFGFQHTNQVPSVFAELLYWQVSEVSDDNWGQVLGPTGTNQQIQFLNLPFHWSPGLRVGVGYNSQDNPLNVLFYYTNYHTTGKRQVSVNAGEIHSAFLGNFFAQNLTGAGVSGPYYQQAGVRWKVMFNTFDLELGRPITIDNLLHLRPFVGLKAASIDQSINTTWQQPFDASSKQPITAYTSAKEQITNDFKGVGPSFGLDSTWHLYNTEQHELKLLGNFSGAFLWGQWTLKDVYENNAPVTITIKNDKMTTGAPMARGYVGLEWAGALNHADMAVRVGYEGQVWFNQLRYYNFDMGRTNDTLFFHGGVLDVSFHF